MSDSYTIVGVLQWVLDNMEAAVGGEFDLLGSIVDSIDLYRGGCDGFGVCCEAASCYERHQKLISLIDDIEREIRNGLKDPTSLEACVRNMREVING